MLVIWIHAVQPELLFPEEELGGAWTGLQQMLGTNLGQIAVPGFFAISGYLFFRNASSLQQGSLKEAASFFTAKWKSRLRTLVLPYLLWNLIYYLIYLAAGRADLSAVTVCKSLFLYRYNPVFWYLQQLIILTVLAPLVWLFVHNKKAALPVLTALFLLAVFYMLLPFHIVNEDALLYFSFGAAAGLHLKAYTEADLKDKKADSSDLLNKWKICLLISMILFLALQAAGNLGTLYGMLYLSITGAIGCRISGFLCLYALLMVADAGRKETPWFMGYNFFIYATHYLVLRAVQHMAAFMGESAGLAMILYILMPAFCIAAGALGGRFLQIRLPRVFQLLTGGRS